ncbi:MAG TPA: enduracididine biosynthesis enzyme MppR [Pseudonocardiaceae bacterium]|nr:enduracididine biosynthesis enzyme MppR [Pseudonocardiaceae bacterium]
MSITANTRRTLGEPTGYSLPLSPSGTSAMLTPPPWHFSGNVIMVDYRVDPDAAAAFLPPGLDPGADPGAAAAVFAEWQWCSDSGAELSDPQRCQFGEFLIMLACEFQGAPMVRCPYAWVDAAVPMVRGWVQGMPKQFGAIHQTRPIPLGRAGSPIAAGSRFAAGLSTFGRRMVEADVALTSRAAQPPLLHTLPMAHTRMAPAWLPGESPSATLVASEVTGVEFSEVCQGDARLRWFAEPGDDLDTLAPLEVGTGYVFSYAETLVGGRPLVAETTR